MHLRSLHARDVGVAAEDLRGPAHGQYRLLKDVPAGATLRKLDKDSQAEQVGQLVCVVTQEQADAGMCYDRSQPFTVNGEWKWPPPRGMWAEVRVGTKNNDREVASCSGGPKTKPQTPKQKTPRTKRRMEELRSLKRRAGVAEQSLAIERQAVQIKKERLDEAEQEYEEEHRSFTVFSKRLEEK